MSDTVSSVMVNFEELLRLRDAWFLAGVEHNSSWMDDPDIEEKLMAVGSALRALVRLEDSTHER